MKILFDQGTPVPLRQFLTAHSISTTFEMHWEALSNGELLKAAESDFDVLITTDQNLRYQQNLSGRKLVIFVLLTTSWLKIRPRVSEIVAAVDGLKAGDYVEFTF